MDYTFYKLTMTAQETLNRIKAIYENISYLKANPSIESKKTIQQLQQELDKLIEL